MTGNVDKGRGVCAAASHGVSAVAAEGSGANIAASACATKAAAEDRDVTATLVKGNIFMFAATLMFGINIPVLKGLIPEWISPLGMTLLRMGGGAVLFWLVSMMIRNDRIVRSDIWRIILGGAVGLFMFIYLFNLSLKFTSPIDVSIIMTLPPVFVILMQVLFMHRRVTAVGIAGILLSLSAAILIIVTQNIASTAHASHSVLGDIIAICSALCYSFYLIIMEGPSRRYRPVSLLRWVFVCAAVPALFFVGQVETSPLVVRGSTEAWLLALFVVVGPSFLAYLLVQPAIRYIGSRLVSVYQYLVPVIAVIASLLMGIGHLRWYQPVAIVIILVGMWLMTRANTTQKVKPYKDSNRNSGA